MGRSQLDGGKGPIDNRIVGMVALLLLAASELWAAPLPRVPFSPPIINDQTRNAPGRKILNESQFSKAQFRFRLSSLTNDQLVDWKGQRLTKLAFLAAAGRRIKAAHLLATQQAGPRGQAELAAARSRFVAAEAAKLAARNDQARNAAQQRIAELLASAPAPGPTGPAGPAASSADATLGSDTASVGSGNLAAGSGAGTLSSGTASVGNRNASVGGENASVGSGTASAGTGNASRGGSNASVGRGNASLGRGNAVGSDTDSVGRGSPGNPSLGTGGAMARHLGTGSGVTQGSVSGSVAAAPVTGGRSDDGPVGGGSAAGQPACSKPQVTYAPPFALSPGSYVAVVGCGFGAAAPESRLILKLQTDKAEIPLAAQEWHDAWITATVPAGLAGLVDQGAFLAVRTAAGESAGWLVPFRAARELRALRASEVPVDRCSTSADANYCNDQSHLDPGYWGLLDKSGAGNPAQPFTSAAGYHADDGSPGGDDGFDVYHVHLAHGWSLAGFAFHYDAEPGAGKAAPPQDFEPGYAEQIFMIPWAISGEGAVVYNLDLFATGPRGTKP